MRVSGWIKERVHASEWTCERGRTGEWMGETARMCERVEGRERGIPSVSG